MRRPLVWFVFFFCLGIYLDSHVSMAFFWLELFTLLFLILCLLMLKRKVLFDFFLCVVIFLLGAVLFQNSQKLSPNHISKYLKYSYKRFSIVKGIIDTPPVLKNGRTSFLFQTKEVQFDHLRLRTCGNILVYVKGNNALDYGQELILGGNLYRPYYLRRGNISLVMNARVMNFSNAPKKNRGFFLKRFAFYLKRKIENIIFSYLPSMPAAILDAMLLGERRMLSPLINNSMIKTGTVHILVVSGFNTSLVALIIISILKLFRVSRKISFYIAIPLIIIYCLMTGASSPVVRATVMAIVFMAAYLLKRETNIYNSCAIAAGFILTVNPHQLFDIGFQLSFISVLSIVYLYPRLKLFFKPELIKIKPARFLIEGFLVSLSAWLGTMGFIAWYFKIFSPITVIANIFIVPLAALITLCGFALVAMGILCPVIAPVFASTNELLVIVLLNINVFLLKIPGAYFNL